MKTIVPRKVLLRSRVVQIGSQSDLVVTATIAIDASVGGSLADPSLPYTRDDCLPKVRGELIADLPHVDCGATEAWDIRCGGIKVAHVRRDSSAAGQSNGTNGGAERLGTYDAAWLAEVYPGLPADADRAVFNKAPADQQLDGFWTGDEQYIVRRGAEVRAMMCGTLPAVRARMFVAKQAEPERLMEVPINLDTVHLHVHERRVALVFRGVIEVSNDDAADVRHLCVALETIGSKRSLRHYETVVESRLTRDINAVGAFADRSLLPDNFDVDCIGAKTAYEAILETDGLVRQRQRRRAEIAYAGAMDQVRALGLDTVALGLPEALPPDAPEPSIEELPSLLDKAKDQADEAKADAERQRAGAERDARKLISEAGLDYNSTMAAPPAGGPPQFSAKAELEKLEALRLLALNSGVELAEADAILDQTVLHARLQEVEAELKESYRRYAQHFPAASARPPADARRLRGELLSAVAAGEAVSGRDFTGADLSSADLKGADLSGAFLEGANLTGACLEGAKLSGTVLTRSDLRDCDLRGADLDGANLGGAVFDRADLSGATLRKAVLSKADLGGGRFHGAELEGAELLEATFREADWTGVRAPGATFLNADLTGMIARDANLEKAIFVEPIAERADFSGANLGAAVFVTLRGNDARFDGAKAANLRVVHNSSLERASFRGATLDGATLRSTKMAGADLSDARLDGADISECDLSGADLRRARAREIMGIRTDLTGARVAYADLLGALLHKAKVGGADFKGASLFGADLAQMRGDDRTRFTDANLGRIRVVPVRKNDGQG